MKIICCFSPAVVCKFRRMNCQKILLLFFLAQWAIPYSNPRVFAWSLRSYLKGIRIEVSKADGQYRALTEGDIHTVCFFDCAFSVFISRDLSTITTLGFLGVRIV